MNTQSIPDTRPLMLPLGEFIIAGRNPNLIEPFIKAYRERFPSAPALQTLMPMPDREKVMPPAYRMSVEAFRPVKPTRVVLYCRQDMNVGPVPRAPNDAAAKNVIVKSMSHTNLREPCTIECFLDDWQGPAEGQPSEVVFTGETIFTMDAAFAIELENNNDAPVLFRGVVFGVSPRPNDRRTVARGAR